MLMASTCMCVRRMVLPKGRVVYRGLKDLGLPEDFLMEDRFGVRGGVEFGLMSTTQDQKVAIQYAESNTPSVFEIKVGAVSRGASLQDLSQYQGEQEILFPPLSYLEVTGETRMVAGPSGRITRVVSLSVTANQTCGTIEELLGSRMRLHVATLENYQLEIKGELEAKLYSEVDALCLETGPRSRVWKARQLDSCPPQPLLSGWRGSHQSAPVTVATLERHALRRFSLECILTPQSPPQAVKERLAHDAMAKLTTHHMKMVEMILMEVRIVVSPNPEP